MLNIDKKPGNTPFRQQRMVAWAPTYGTGGSVCCMMSLAAFMLPVGAVMLVASRDIDRVQVRYDDHEELRDCPWVRRGANERCFDYPCEAGVGNECSKQSSCGMLANLAEHCPRNFQNLDLAQIRAAGEGCDPHCTASFNFTITETIPSPVYIYYKIANFWQNHRGYVDSRSESQLAGGSSAGGCSPYLHAGERSNDTWCREITSNGSFSGYKCDDMPFKNGGVKTVGDLTYAPCGLSAWSMFNDSFVLSDASSGDVLCDGGSPGGACTKNDISWKSDRDYRYDSPSVSDSTFMAGGFGQQLEGYYNGSGSSVEDVEKVTAPYLYHGWYLFEPYHKIPSQLDEDLMVWNKVATLDTFHKLYRKYNSDLPPGTYRVDVKHRFDVTPFNGEKYFVLSTAKWMGGKNEFMAILLLTLGSVCFTVAVMMTIHFLCYNKEREGVLEEWVVVLKERADASRSGEVHSSFSARRSRARHSIPGR